MGKLGGGGVIITIKTDVKSMNVRRIPSLEGD